MIDVLEFVCILFLLALHFVNRNHIFKLDNDWSEALKSVREHFKIIDDKIWKGEE